MRPHPRPAPPRRPSHTPRGLARWAALALLALPGALVAESASATKPFGPKSSREVFPKREIERPLDMPRAWSEFSLAQDFKIATGSWTPEGTVEPFEDARWIYRTTTIAWRYGLSRRSEMGWVVPIHLATLRNDALGTNTTNGSVGDIRFRYLYQLYEDTDGPLTSAVFEGEVKGPTGRETPGTYAGGPNQVSSFIFTTGSWDVYLGLAGKQQLGPGALTLRLGYQRRISGLVQYVVETNQNQFVGRIKPGDRFIADLEGRVQLGPVSLAARPVFMLRDRTRLGVTADNWFNPGANLDPVAGSGGWSLDIHGELTVMLSRGVDLHARMTLPLRGEDLQFFPIEDIHPTYGPTFGGAAEVRF